MTSLKKNVVYNFGYQLLVLALPLVTAPYLSRVIGAEGIGIYSYSYSVATYFVYFVMLGLNNYGNRTVAAVQHDRETRTRVFWSIYAMQVTCFVVVGAVYVLYAFLLAADRTVALLQGLYVLSSLFDINWFFFGMELFKISVLRNAVVKLSTTLLVFIFVRGPEDVGAYVALMCGGTLVSQLVLWPFLRRYVGLCSVRPADVLPHVRPNLVLFVSVLAVSVYNVLSRILLGALAGDAPVGFFDNAAKLEGVPVALVGAVGTVMLPRTSALLASGDVGEASRHTERTLRAVMAFTCLAAFGIPAVAAPFVEVFYGPGFQQSAECLSVLVAAVPLLGFGNVVRTQYLIPSGRDTVYVVSAVCGAVASLSLNLLLIPRMGAVGAAFASVGAEAAVLTYQLVRVRRELPLRCYVLLALRWVLCGALMAAVLLLVPSMGSPVADVLLNVGFGVAVYAALGFLTGPAARSLIHK